MTNRRKEEILEILKRVSGNDKDIDTIVDVVKLAIANGFFVCRLKEGTSINGMMIVSNNNSKNTPNKIIAFQPNLSEKDNRFIIAHELGHYFLHFSQSTNTDNYQFVYSYHGNKQKMVEEEEADFFATNLLVPEQLFIKKNEELGNLKETKFGIDYLSNFFRVNKKCIEKRYSEIYAQQ